MDALIVYFYLALLGLVLGSFASVLIHRIRERESGICLGRSHCPDCEHMLAWYDLFPVLSYACLGGRCHYCRERIPAWYPLLELAMAAAFVLVGSMLGHVSGIVAGDPWALLGTLWFLGIVFVVVTFSAYDIRFQEVPDEVMVPAILVTFALLFLDSLTSVPHLFGYMIPLASPLLSIPLFNGLLGAFAVYTFFYLQILIPGLADRSRALRTLRFVSLPRHPRSLLSDAPDPFGYSRGPG